MDSKHVNPCSVFQEQGRHRTYVFQSAMIRPPIVTKATMAVVGMDGDWRFPRRRRNIDGHISYSSRFETYNGTPMAIHGVVAPRAAIAGLPGFRKTHHFAAHWLLRLRIRLIGRSRSDAARERAPFRFRGSRGATIYAPHRCSCADARPSDI